MAAVAGFNAGLCIRCGRFKDAAACADAAEVSAHWRAQQPLNRRTTCHQLLSPHVCEHTHDTPDQAHVSIMRACSDAWLKARTVGGGARGVQREQRAHRHARCPLLPQPRPSGGKQTCARGSHSCASRTHPITSPSSIIRPYYSRPGVTQLLSGSMDSHQTLNQHWRESACSAE